MHQLSVETIEVKINTCTYIIEYKITVRHWTFYKQKLSLANQMSRLLSFIVLPKGVETLSTLPTYFTTPVLLPI